MLAVTPDKAMSAIVITFNKFSCDEVEKVMERLFNEVKDGKKKSMILEVASRYSELAALLAYAEDAKEKPEEEKPKAKNQASKKSAAKKPKDDKPKVPLTDEEREEKNFLPKDVYQCVIQCLEKVMRVFGKHDQKKPSLNPRCVAFINVLATKFYGNGKSFKESFIDDACAAGSIKFKDTEQSKRDAFYGGISKAFSDYAQKQQSEAPKEEPKEQKDGSA